MPKLISNMQKLTIVVHSLDKPSHVISENMDISLLTVRNILKDPEMQEFRKELIAARKRGIVKSMEFNALDLMDTPPCS